MLKERLPNLETFPNKKFWSNDLCLETFEEWTGIVFPHMDVFVCCRTTRNPEPEKAESCISVDCVDR